MSTGRSQAAFALELAPDGSSFAIVNTAGYAQHVNDGRSLEAAQDRAEASLSGLEDTLADALLSSLG